MLHRLLVDMRGADYGEDAAAGRQGHRAADAGAGALDGVHDLLGRLVQDLMVEGFELDADLLLHDYSTIPVTTPAPTVRPPSRMANRSSSSRATGVLRAPSRFPPAPRIPLSTPPPPAQPPRPAAPPSFPPPPPPPGVLRNLPPPAPPVRRASGRSPTTSTSSPTFTFPRSTRPVATVPRPVIVKMSSTAIRKGFSTSRTGVGMYESTASINS